MSEPLDLMSAFSDRDLEEFSENVVWLAFLQTIKDRVEIIRTELEVGTIMIKTAEGNKVARVLSIEDLKRRQGECAGLRFLMRLPEIVKEIREQGEQKLEGGNDA